MAYELPALTRDDEIMVFLNRAGWGEAERLPIPGDASFRRYERILRASDRAILMDAPPERENAEAFVAVQDYLLSAGLRAPRRLAGEATRGLLLLEDFGDRSVSLALRERPDDEAAIYRDAVDVLIHVTRQGMTGAKAAGNRFVSYDAPLLLNELELLPQWFLPELLDERSPEAGEAFRAVWRDLWAQTDLSPEVVVHRDYHADNLFLLDDMQGPERIGLLDFQDAVLGRAAYDLVSLLTDARRDVDPAVAEASLRQFIQATDRDDAAFRAEFALYSAQRNAKILGIFTRLFRRDGKARYLDMIPRVWRHFDESLEHPALSSLKEWRQRYITADAEARLPQLKRLLAEEGPPS